MLGLIHVVSGLITEKGKVTSESDTNYRMILENYECIQIPWSDSNMLRNRKTVSTKWSRDDKVVMKEENI